MRILLINSVYAPNIRGGAERAIQNLAEALVERGHEAIAASTVARAEAGARIVNGVKAVYLPIANLHWPFDGIARSAARRKLWHLADSYNPGMKRQISRLIGELRPDVIHTSNLQGISVAAWHAARAAGTPILHTLQDYYLTCGRCSRYRGGRTCETTCWDCLPLFLARRSASAAVSGVTGVSRYILEHHQRLGLFPKAAFAGVIAHDSPTTATLERATPPADGPLTFGYFGRLVPEKGIELLIDAFSARRAVGRRLLIAGQGSEAYSGALARRAAAGNGEIRFLGWIEPPEFFQKIDILLLPSLWQEPLARVVLEAFAYGVPVIGSLRGGIPEQLRDGVNGLLFEPETPETLQAAVDRLLEDRGLLKRLSGNAIQSARENSRERIVSAYTDAYRAVLAAENTRRGEITIRG